MGSENEETWATHPDPTQRKNPDPTQSSRQVTDVTDPIQSATYTMKLRANHILCVGVLVLLGLVLLSTQVQAESEVEPEPTRGLLWYPGWKHPAHPLHPAHPIGQWLHGRRLLARQVKADDSEQVFQMKPESELEPEPTRALQLWSGWKHPDADDHPAWDKNHPAHSLDRSHPFHPHHPVGRTLWGR